MAQQSRVLREVLRAYAYVVLWMAVSSSVILFNKWLLAFSGFPYPIALTSWHMAFCSTVGVLCVRGLRVVKSHNMSGHDYLRRVMPIGATRLFQRALVVHTLVALYSAGKANSNASVRADTPAQLRALR